MGISITVPRLGWSMDEGTFVRWLKRPGEFVNTGEPLFELEGEKAVQEIESLDSGILEIPAGAPQPGSVVPVGAVLGYLLAEGESALDVDANGAAAGVARSEDLSPAGSLDVAQTDDASAVEASSNNATRTHSSPSRDLNEPSKPRSSPRARRAAAALGIDWRRLTGTGRTGRIRERDVHLAAQAQGNRLPEPQVQRAPFTQPSTPGTQSMSTLRKTIARRMMTSCQQTAPVTLTTRADATNLVSLRDQFRSRGGDTLVPSYVDIIVKVVALALREHPQLNARSDGDQVVQPEGMHIGMAVDTEAGLVVPVIHDVVRLSLRDVARRSRDLIERARNKTVTAADLEGGTFTVTNLGSFGIDAFTPIINYPETAILGLGAIRREPVVSSDDRLTVRSQITLSLTFDHRVVDGAPAARFLQSVVRGLESPAAWLIDEGS